MFLFAQHRLHAWVARLRAQLALPVPLRIELWDGRSVDLSPEAPRVTVRLPQPSAARYLLAPSLARLGAAYVEGAIDVRGKARDMIAIVHALASLPRRRFGRWRGDSGRPRAGASAFPALQRLHRLCPWHPLHALKQFRHDRHRDAAAIRYHYDVSNAFYAQFLDPALVYSCAYFEHGNEDLASAQRLKIDHILRKIGLQPQHTLLDIGCGWGALVLQAARQYGVRCVGVTLSREQYALATERVRAAGLAHLVDIRLQDYRDITGCYDRITSVGMFEHVGVRQLPAYFAAINSLLAPGGVVMNHGITSTDADDGETPYGGGEFIARYVFPHGELAHLGTVLKAMQQGGLEVIDVENLRRHYARTCALWSDNFEDHAASVRALGGDKRFRIWQVYLAGASHAFEQDWISLYQVVGHKAGQPGQTLPWSRRHMYPCPPLH